MPQTRFVLRKALELDHRVIVVINKVDRADARPAEVVDEVLDLLIDLNADESQLDCPFLFASARAGYCSDDMDARSGDMRPLFESIMKHIPAPVGDPDAPLQTLISTIDYNEYVGRIGIGRVERGTITRGQNVARLQFDGDKAPIAEKIGVLYRFEGLNRVDVDKATVGDIIALSGMDELSIGDTLCDPATPEPLPFVKISEPTVAVTFSVNDSPFSGREGKYVTSRHLRARLMREMLTDMSLKVEDTSSTDAFKVLGRGELHLTVLIETMRRQGYEFQVSKPEVLMRTVDGKLYEPMERVVVDVPEESMGAVIEKLGRRKGQMTAMSGSGRMRLEFSVPSRGLFGYRSEFLTDTRGEGIMSAVFDGYEPHRGEIPTRNYGSLLAYEDGEAVTYGLFYAQDRGELFITPGTRVYHGMVVGQNMRTGDIDLNVCKTKHLTGVRNSAAAEDAMRLKPVRPMTLEHALEFIGDDELVEITPENIRMRKRILDSTQRMRANRSKG
jgi:GTP-binding protein